LPFGDRVSLIQGDVATFDFGTGIDLVVTSFALHHTEDAVKRAVYERVESSLQAEGFFANLDFVHSASLYFAQLFDDLRIREMRQTGVSEERIATEYIEHRKLERPTPMQVQLGWLQEIGFTEVECFWKHLNLAGFCGRKSSH
jgi:tRNA (cmo5U34)-methyltransferase